VYGLFSAAAYDIGETCDQLGQHYEGTDSALFCSLGNLRDNQRGRST